MSKEERIELIEKFYDGDVSLYFYDQVKEYCRVIPFTEKNLECFRDCIEQAVQNVKEILNDEQ